MTLPNKNATTHKTSWWSRFYQPVREEYQRLASDNGSEVHQYKYMPYINLVYLMFLFLPLFFNPRFGSTHVIVTLASLAIFLPLHFMSYRNTGRHMILISSAMVLLCYAVLPFNFGANTYLIYGVISAAYVFKARNALLFLVVALVLMVIQTALLKLHIMFFATTAVMASMLVFYTLYSRSIERSNQSLRLSQQEVQRLAQSAERERIGRDLHDVLGHTMSLIVMKSELASRLFERDPNAAAVQIREVEKIARDSLGQIRMAVAGIRLAGLEAELANARLSLLSADIQLHYQLAPVALSTEVETVLALAVREAVTNIIRHSNAGQVEIELIKNKNTLQLQISDDGKNKLVTPGHGLSGMRERLELLGGQLEVDTGPNGGVRLKLSCPISEHQPANNSLNDLVTRNHEC
jgi:two-component system, NarL family, sensor histidine kinase DesK